MLIKKGIFIVNDGKIAYGIAKILRAVQRTHMSNMPRSPLYANKGCHVNAFENIHTKFHNDQMKSIGAMYICFREEDLHCTFVELFINKYCQIKLTLFCVQLNIPYKIVKRKLSGCRKIQDKFLLDNLIKKEWLAIWAGVRKKAEIL